MKSIEIKDANAVKEKKELKNICLGSIATPIWTLEFQYVRFCSSSYNKRLQKKIVKFWNIPGACSKQLWN